MKLNLRGVVCQCILHPGQPVLLGLSEDATLRKQSLAPTHGRSK
jgi:hypothetical protein